MIGAYYDDDGGSASGTVYVFRTTDGATYSQMAKLTTADAAAYDQFGRSVAIDGATVVIGAYYDDGGSASGSVYAFRVNMCFPGTFSDDGFLDSAGQCSACAASTYQPLSGQSECVICAAGRFSAEDNAIDCEECPAGRSQPVSGQSECIVCLPGMYAASGSINCDHCPYDTYSSSPEAAFCDPCPDNMKAGLGQSYCSRCLPGEGEYVADDGGITCVTCQTGMFSPLGLYCEVAPLGWYTPDAVQSLPCAAGGYANMTYATECEECPAGRSQPASGQSECIECVPGTYQSEAGHLGCEPCAAYPLGRESLAGATSCDYCGEGLFLGNDIFTTDGKNCFDCPAHADCATGTTLETLGVHPGYWRTNPTSPKLKRCFRESACVGGNASQCATGYHKTLCASCEADYYHEVSTGECHKCDSAATRRTRHFFGLHLFLLLLFCASPFVVARFVRTHARKAAKLRFRSARSEKWWSRSAKALLPKVGRVVPAEALVARPPWGPDLTGTFVKVRAGEVWRKAEIVEPETDHGGVCGICIQYTDDPSADEEFHAYESEDILYFPRSQTPEATPRPDDADDVYTPAAPKIHLRNLHMNASLDLDAILKEILPDLTPPQLRMTFDIFDGIPELRPLRLRFLEACFRVAVPRLPRPRLDELLECCSAPRVPTSRM